MTVQETQISAATTFVILWKGFCMGYRWVLEERLLLPQHTRLQFPRRSSSWLHGCPQKPSNKFDYPLEEVGSLVRHE